MVKQIPLFGEQPRRKPRVKLTDCASGVPPRQIKFPLSLQQLYNFLRHSLQYDNSVYHAVPRHLLEAHAISMITAFKCCLKMTESCKQLAIQHRHSLPYSRDVPSGSRSNVINRCNCFPRAVQKPIELTTVGENIDHPKRVPLFGSRVEEPYSRFNMAQSLFYMRLTLLSHLVLCDQQRGTDRDRCSSKC